MLKTKVRLHPDDFLAQCNKCKGLIIVRNGKIKDFVDWTCWNCGGGKEYTSDIEFYA